MEPGARGAQDDPSPLLHSPGGFNSAQIATQARPAAPVSGADAAAADAGACLPTAALITEESYCCVLPFACSVSSKTLAGNRGQSHFPGFCKCMDGCVCHDSQFSAMITITGQAAGLPCRSHPHACGPAVALPAHVVRAGRPACGRSWARAHSKLGDDLLDFVTGAAYPQHPTVLCLLQPPRPISPLALRQSSSVTSP